MNNEPTLAKIVAGLRGRANQHETLHRVYCNVGGAVLDKPKPEIITTLRAAADRLEAQDRALAEVRALGEVLVPPKDWDYPGAGGPPNVWDCDKADLSRAGL